MDIAGVEPRALLNAFPMPAMLLDGRHHILDANTLMAREFIGEDRACWFSCYTLVHGTDKPVLDCPLVEAVATGRPAERIVTDNVNGRLRVSISPLDLTANGSGKVDLHLVQPVD